MIAIIMPGRYKIMAAKNNENVDLKYIKKVISEVMGEDLWNGFYDVVTTERPRIDMYDDGKTLLVLAEAPSIQNTEDVVISVYGGRLNIKGVSRDKYQRHKPGKMLKCECLYGAFNRSIELPYAVDGKNIKAVYENGMLEIIMQKAYTEEEESVEIEFKK
jgi:HSP20 family protein